MKLSERITRWRESREGLTKAGLAREVGVSAATVSYWEQGETEPTHENTEKIAEAIGVSLSVFWGEPPAALKKAKAS
jgi:transcriptional regulator with XRE-family HTH domain